MIKKGVFASIVVGLFLVISCVCCSQISDKVNTTTIWTGGKDATTLEEEKYHDSVVIVESTPGTLGYVPKLATGFALDADHILTVGHFCLDVAWEQKLYKAGKYIRTIAADNRGLPKTPFYSEMVAFDEKTDICLLFSRGHGITPLALADTITTITAEDRITVIGAPLGYFPIRRDGRVISTLAYRFKPYNNMLFLAVNIQKGSSGSPVIMGGAVIGMIAVVPFYLDETALAVPIDSIREFLDKNVSRP
jgi:hypothetical protein